MPAKPTYEELETRVRELERAETERRKPQTALGESEEPYRNLIDFSPLPFLVTQEEKIVYANPSAAKLFGTRHQDELVGSSPQDWIHPDFVEQAYRRRQRIIQAGESLDPIELTLLRQDKKEVVVIANATRISHNGSPALLSIFHDITERKQAEATLREREAFIKTVMDQLPIGVAVNSVDPSVEFSYMNDNFPKIYRTTREALAEPDTFWDVVYEDPVFREKIKNRVAEDVASGNPDRMYWKDVPFTRKGEGPFFICARNIPLEGKQVMISTVWDVTDRKQSEEALRESLDLLDATQRLAKVGGWVWDVASQTMTWTDQTYLIHGFEPGEVTPGSPEHIERSLSCYDPDDRPAIEAAFLRCVEEGIPYDLEFPFTTVDGRRRWIQTMAQPVFDGKRLVRVIGNIVDITERRQAEESLATQRAQLKSLFHYSGEAIVLLDMENHILEANSGFESIFGYSLEEARGELIEDLICPDRFYYTESKELDEQSLNGIKDVEIIRKRKDGEEIDVRVSAGPIKLGDRIIGRFVVFDDITEHKRAEEALRESEERHRSIIQTAMDGFWLTDLQGHFLQVNEAYCRMSGYSVKDFMSMSISDVEALETADETAAHIKTLVDEGEARFETRHRREDGSIYDLEVSAQFLPLEGGRIVAFIRDISERNRAEEEIEREARLRNVLLDNMPNCIALILKKQTHEIVASNKAAAAMGAVPGKTCFGTCAEREDECPFCLAPELWTTNQLQELEVEYRGKWYEGVWAPFTDNLYIHYIFDITESKRAKEEREKLQTRLAQAHKMEAIGTLAGGIAHDFNNILSIIVGNTELAMLDVPEWSPAQDNLKEVREATLRARELVKQILMFARQKEHTVSNIRLEPVAKESIKMLRASIPTTVKIRKNIREGLPSVLADPSQIQQIIMNLCTNAGQVMEAEGGTLTFTLDSADLETPLYTLVEELPPGRYVRMQVKDTGPGIPPENLERIFDPFFTTKDVGEGTGLGLAVVHGIVQERSGGIIVESKEGLGTTFSIYLPASEVESVEVTAEQKMELPRGTERVLFVDDEPMIMKLGQHMLERQGYKVETRASGTDALECFRQDPHRFDLVVTDMTMPGMRGDRLAEEILTIRPEIPVILCTGYSRQISKEKAREIGVSAFVMKPLTQHELANTVRRVLDEKPRK